MMLNRKLKKITELTIEVFSSTRGIFKKEELNNLTYNLFKLKKSIEKAYFWMKQMNKI